jgi:hypothetical protein
MQTLREFSETRSDATEGRNGPIEAGMRKLAPSLSRAAADTAAAFFCARATPGSAWDAPRIPDPVRMQCSQRNIGEKFELRCTLTTDKAAFSNLFPAGMPEPIQLDAYRELANCICGTVLADEGFQGEFGYLIPCVPSPGPDRPPAGSRSVSGSFRMAGTWIHYSFAVLEILPDLVAASRFQAAA